MSGDERERMRGERERKLHVAMYPWFALGHLTPFLHLANKLAQRGHTVSFFLTAKARPKLAHLNFHPTLISFITVPLPAVNGLPIGAQMTVDTPVGTGLLLFDAFDLTWSIIDSSLSQLKPDFVFFDYAHWLPSLARKYGARPIYFSTTYISFYAYMARPPRGLRPGTLIPEAELMRAPPGFPLQVFWLQAHEARELDRLAGMTLRVSKMSVPERMYIAIEESDAVCCKSCKEMEGSIGEYFEKHYQKPMLWAGPMLSGPPMGSGELDEKLDGWLKGFEKGCVVYCALGSECVLPKEQFQELVLGLELTGLPFVAFLKSPPHCETTESAVPRGLLERVKERGIIQLDGWVQQHLILKHPSIGCFITHCGAGSLSEALVSGCQLVQLPLRGDQFINSRLMSEELRVGIEVQKGEEDGFFTKEAICDAVMTVMDEESNVGKQIRINHTKWREILLRKGLEDGYINDFINSLQSLVLE